MMRLVRRGLMFGNLFAVRSPTLVERYNRALEHLTGRRTTLTEFHLDISGYSPEIGDEFGDDLYLNPNGCNRQFILLSTEQKTAPLLNAKFSTSRSILRRWMDENELQLFALTAKDAVAGELVNSVFSIDSPNDLLAIRRIEVEADTTASTVEDGKILQGKIDRFLSEEDAWWDDVLIAEMIEISKKTGDITRNPVVFTHNSFQQNNFYTSHFGGLYVFRDLEEAAVISVRKVDDVSDWDVEYVMDFTQRNDIATFLAVNNLVEPVTSARGRDVAAILQQKLDFIVVDTAASLGERFENPDRRELRRLARRNLKQLPKEYEGLYRLWQWARGQGDWPRISSEHPAYFYTLRASDHADRDLVNMLLAELAPLDVRQLFICHKEAFYRAYAGWSDTKKDYVAEYLASEYMMDKAGAREELFGHEPAMEEPEPTRHPRKRKPVGQPWGRRADDDDDDDDDDDYDDDDRDMIQRVGPWGAVKRR
ncbi:MAG: hypothetical protein GYB24_09435 [Rhodobacteraceae bacterium]|nr:hypothetical protein [Paracoccaceae bacterium]